MSSTGSAQASFQFLSILALIFITLKLTGYITWSWWWITAPMWIAPAILLVIAVAFLAVVAVVGIGVAIAGIVGGK